MANTIHCRLCGTSVIVKSDGTCPACGCEHPMPIEGHSQVLSPAEAMASLAQNSGTTISVGLDADNAMLEELDAADDIESQAVDDVNRRYEIAAKRSRRRTSFWIMMASLGLTLGTGYVFFVMLLTHRVVDGTSLGLVILSFAGFVAGLIGWLRGNISLRSVTEVVDEHVTGES